MTRTIFLVKQLLIVSFFKDLKKSFIGVGWLVFGPLISVATWILLHSAGIIKPGDADIPYPAYVLLSTSMWSLFVGTYKSVSTTLKSNGRMLIMVDVPQIALVADKVITEVIRFIILIVITLIVLTYFKVNIPWTIVLMPLTLAPLIAFGTIIGLFNALFKIVAVDLSRLLDNAMGFLMFLTPIVYTPKIEFGFLSSLIAYNPLTYLIELPRTLMTVGLPQSMYPWTLTTVLIFAVLPLVWKYYKRKAKYVIERIISV